MTSSPTIIPKIYEKIGAVLTVMKLQKRDSIGFNAKEFTDLYSVLFPEDAELMRNRQTDLPNAHSLAGYLNGMLAEYARHQIGDRASAYVRITPLSNLEYRF